MPDAVRPGTKTSRRRMAGLIALGLFCGLVDLAGAWKAAHPHVSAAYRALYLTPGAIKNGTNCEAARTARATDTSPGRRCGDD
ncbi:hypothetical protein [Acetobacter fallax]|uniref:Uncharacterized protein n=1 Tax=Acetobacter fallax TaxID=1737473 RepID=A0ABX0KB42_9PROT|nr:hypothetical protein [Acetobacter fallax]NHO33376.1 hypothetical protein [Acetobacter fallax]NHO36995.1 hypothetical protein [Acetobacter fallax]